MPLVQLSRWVVLAYQGWHSAPCSGLTSLPVLCLISGLPACCTLRLPAVGVWELRGIITSAALHCMEGGRPTGVWRGSAWKPPGRPTCDSRALTAPLPPLPPLPWQACTQQELLRSSGSQQGAAPSQRCAPYPLQPCSSHEQLSVSRDVCSPSPRLPSLRIGSCLTASSKHHDSACSPLEGSNTQRMGSGTGAACGWCRAP